MSEKLKDIQSKCGKDFEELKEELNKLKNEWQAKAKASFKEAFSTFFSVHPEVKMICWDQYTPYFNDGDECYFSVNEVFYVKEDVNEDGVKINPGNGSWRMEDEGQVWQHWNPERDHYMSAELQSSTKSMDSLINDLEDFLKATFGDHVTVVVTPEGIETFELEHD